ncbi:SH3 domain-binding glutamic acid-rich protein homolog [Diabrotica undecimpunctata]|uniref:SH3 domain-binding glutamic acid-rich protein homolog n=1 Tax=Diabrotica undecimpunctata TaxID=50387 RepID=UPI003B6425C3
MVVQVYITGVSCNTEVKSRQQRVLSILDSKSIKYEIVDITGEDGEKPKAYMQLNATSLGGTLNDPVPKHPLPPQLFNDGIYCGDYDMFDEANELGELKSFLKIEETKIEDSSDVIAPEDVILVSNKEIELIE